jgi:FkbM family methyltransferase
MYSLSNDLVFIESLNRGVIYEEEMVLENLIPRINNITGKKVILDIGGHIGSHSLLYSKYVDNCQIHTFEPQSVLFNLLTMNININSLDNIKLYNNAVGHKECICNMSSKLYDGYDCDIEYFTNKVLNYGGLQLGSDGEETTMITIDSLGLSNCHYIKIDVEGAESLVLLGGLHTIRKFKPMIFFESTDKIVNNEMKTALDIDFVVPMPIDILVNEGYKIIDIDHCNKLAIFDI